MVECSDSYSASPHRRKNVKNSCKTLMVLDNVDLTKAGLLLTKRQMADASTLCRLFTCSVQASRSFVV